MSEKTAGEAALNEEAAAGNAPGFDGTFQPQIGRTLASLLQADAAVLVRNRRSLIVAIILPLFILLASKRAAVSGSAALLGASITFGLVSIGILGYSMSVARDREKGVFQRLRVTPAPGWAIMTSRIAVQVAASLVMSAVVLIVAGEVDHIVLSPVGYLLAAASALVGAAMFLSIGQMIVGIIKSADTINSLARFIYIGVVLFGLLGESGKLGAALASVATWSPYGTIAAMFAGAGNTSAWTGETWLAVAASLGYILVFAGIGIKWFRWSTD